MMMSIFKVSLLCTVQPSNNNNGLNKVEIIANKTNFDLRQEHKQVESSHYA
jgi:hypothetical protein